MTDYRERNLDFRGNGLPTLAGKTRGNPTQVLLTERFDAGRTPIPGISEIYGPAVEWPAGWESWDLKGNLLALSLVDGSQRCGVIGVVNAPIGETGSGDNVVGMLRPFPATPRDNNLVPLHWYIFARIGVYALFNASGGSANADSEKMFGLLLSATDLLHGGVGGDPTDGEFVFARCDQGNQALASLFTDHTTQDSAVTADVIGQPLYLRILASWDPGDNLSRISCEFSSDAQGYLSCPSESVAFEYQLKGKLATIGFAANANCSANNEQVNARLDYLHVFGFAARDPLPIVFDPGIEGIQSYF